MCLKPNIVHRSSIVGSTLQIIDESHVFEFHVKSSWAGRFLYSCSPILFDIHTLQNRALGT